MTGAAAVRNAEVSAERRTLRFASENDAIAEVEHLRRVGYREAGTWTLQQVAWHCAAILETSLTPPSDPSAKATAEQTVMKDRFFAKIRSTVPHATGALKAPPMFEPPADCEDADIDRLITRMTQLRDYAHPLVVMGPMGPVPIGECREAHLIHAAHHLGHLVPRQA